MKIWSIEATAAKPKLALGADPVPAKGESVVRVAAVGLNFADLLMIEGKYQVRPPMPYVPGMEFAGIVESLGPDTVGLAAGTRVLGTCVSGALAERIAVPAAGLSPIPDVMSLEEAAGFPIAYGTSHLALTHKARRNPARRCLSPVLRGVSV